MVLAQTMTAMSWSGSAWSVRLGLVAVIFLAYALAWRRWRPHGDAR